MKFVSISGHLSIPPPPEPLAQALAQVPEGLGKRERTQRQLLEAAIQVFASRGVAGATMQDIAATAGMANGTVYNHFKTKEEIVQAVAVWLALALCRRIDDSYRHITEGAERMAIGNRRYLWLAEQSPAWGLLLLDVGAAAPQLVHHIQNYMVEDLRLGVKQRAFRIASEAAALDLVNGTIGQAMRSLALGIAPPGHGVAVATTVLRGLGVAFDAAAEIAARPLPEFAPLADPAPR